MARTSAHVWNGVRSARVRRKSQDRCAKNGLIDEGVRQKKIPDFRDDSMSDPLGTMLNEKRRDQPPAPAVLFDVDAAILRRLLDVGGSDWLRFYPLKSSPCIPYIFIEIGFPILAGSALALNGIVQLLQNVYLLL